MTNDDTSGMTVALINKHGETVDSVPVVPDDSDDSEPLAVSVDARSQTRGTVETDTVGIPPDYAEVLWEWIAADEFGMSAVTEDDAISKAHNALRTAIDAHAEAERRDAAGPGEHYIMTVTRDGETIHTERFDHGGPAYYSAAVIEDDDESLTADVEVVDDETNTVK